MTMIHGVIIVQTGNLTQNRIACLNFLLKGKEKKNGMGEKRYLPKIRISWKSFSLPFRKRRL